MRAFGIDPDAIAKLSERREPTNINEFVAAALHSERAKETARARKAEELEDLGSARKEIELRDESELEGHEESIDIGRILPDQVQDKLAGILGRLGDSLDPDAESLLSHLLPKAGLGADASDSETSDDGTTENLGELLESIREGRAERYSAGSSDMDDWRRQQKEREDKMEKAAEERRADLARRQEQRNLDHEKFEAEMAEREEQRKKDRAEFEEGRRKHAEYMERMEERKKQSEKRRAEMEEKRLEREARMEAALKMAGEHIAELKGKSPGKNRKTSPHDDL